MSGFFSKIFGGKKKEASNPIEERIQQTLQELIDKAGFDLDFQISSSQDEQGENQVLIELSGQDEELIKDKDGQMIDSIQLFLKRVLQHNFSDDRTNVVIDCNGFREESQQALVELAEKLKSVALEKGKSVYFRALPPRDRKVIHQYLAGDERVKSRSVGDGLFKKIKIYPAKNASQEEKSND